MTHRIMGAITKAREFEPNHDFGSLQAHEAELMQYALAAYKNSEARHWHLLDTPHRLRILTIDSFCGGLVQQMPLLSSMGGRPNVVEDSNKAYDNAVEALIENLSNKGWPRSLQILYKHLNCDIDRVARLLSGLLAHRDQWLPMLFSINAVGNSDTDLLRQTLESAVQQWAIDILDDLSKSLKLVEGELCELLDFAGANLTGMGAHSNAAKLKGIDGFPRPPSPPQPCLYYPSPGPRAVPSLRMPLLHSKKKQ